MRKVPGLTSCTLCRVWPAAAFRFWPWATWAIWAWLSPDSCRIGCEIVVALEDETWRTQQNKLQLNTKPEKTLFESSFCLGGPGFTVQGIVRFNHVNKSQAKAFLTGQGYICDCWPSGGAAQTTSIWLHCLIVCIFNSNYKPSRRKIYLGGLPK